jgi:dinuclear metal center YbgI/SA1388 family protein
VVDRSELERWLNLFLNVETVEDSLPNGLQIEGAREVRKILTAVSISAEVIEQAVREGADTIIVHHGMFWKNDDPTVKGYRRTRLSKLLAADINLFAYHLPLDLHPEISHNRLILERLGAVLRNAAAPGPTAGGKASEGAGGSGGGHRRLGKEYDFGLTGVFPEPIGFSKLLERINRVLDTNAGAFHYGPELIRSLFVVSGAGRSLVDKVAALGVDAYLTGDAQENTAYVAKEERLNYIHAGHYNTEKVGIAELGKRIAGVFQVDVGFCEIVNPL